MSAKDKNKQIYNVEQTGAEIIQFPLDRVHPAPAEEAEEILHPLEVKHPYLKLADGYFSEERVRLARENRFRRTKEFLDKLNGQTVGLGEKYDTAPARRQLIAAGIGVVIMAGGAFGIPAGINALNSEKPKTEHVTTTPEPEKTVSSVPK
jgi:hypothetical protein